jgi:hypothetical protein
METEVSIVGWGISSNREIGPRGNTTTSIVGWGITCNQELGPRGNTTTSIVRWGIACNQELGPKGITTTSNVAWVIACTDESGLRSTQLKCNFWWTETSRYACVAPCTWASTFHQKDPGLPTHILNSVKYFKSVLLPDSVPKADSNFPNSPTSRHGCPSSFSPTLRNLYLSLATWRDNSIFVLTLYILTRSAYLLVM